MLINQYRTITRQYGNLIQAKRKLIQAEIEWLRHIKPEEIPVHISEKDYNHLEHLFKTRKYGRLTWLDISYHLRLNYLEQLRQIEIFDGQALIQPICSCILENIHRRKQLSLLSFATNVAFDITFDNYMSSLECKNLAEQLIQIIHMNNNEFRPNFFNLHITGLSQSIMTKQFLNNFLDPSHDKYFPNLNFHDKTFVELFPSQNIIYLSPHATEVLDRKTIDSNVIFIIGGIVDRRKIIELTVSKCKKLGIQTKCLPIDGHKQIKSLYDVIKIMNKLIH